MGYDGDMAKKGLAIDPRKLGAAYGFAKRSASQKAKAKSLVKSSFKKSRILLIGFGGTISSGYTPTKETIVPLFPSPAIKQIDYFNLFKISALAYDHIDLAAKDSRKINEEDLRILLDAIHLASNEKILITAGTYLLPKIAETLFYGCADTKKNIVLTGSILPAGFVASDADANIWSAITTLNMPDQKVPSVSLVFHGRVFSTPGELKKLNLHPKAMHDMVIQYPLSSVPVDGVL